MIHSQGCAETIECLVLQNRQATSGYLSYEICTSQNWKPDATSHKLPFSQNGEFTYEIEDFIVLCNYFEVRCKTRPEVKSILP